MGGSGGGSPYGIDGFESGGPLLDEASGVIKRLWTVCRRNKTES